MRCSSSGKNITEVAALTITAATEFFDALDLSPSQMEIAGKVLEEVRQRTGFLHQVGLDYLTLDRLSSTLSGGESQRIQLATSLGSRLVGALYVLDEPSIGLHTRDTAKLIHIMEELRDLGNTILVVEHDPDVIRAADYLLDLGPGAGELGGQLLAAGTVAEVESNPNSITGKYLSGRATIPVPKVRREPGREHLKLTGARIHNLRGVDLDIPLGLLCCVTGVSGSGKSTIVHQVLYRALQAGAGPGGRRRRLHRCTASSDRHAVSQRVHPGRPVAHRPHAPLQPRHLHQGIRRHPRPVRRAARCQAQELRSGRLQLQRARRPLRCLRRRRHRDGGNAVPRGHRTALRRVQRHSLQGGILDVKYKGKNIYDVLSMTVKEALVYFAGHPKIVDKLYVLDEVGLGYVRLGQSATTLSGGEAQRVKLASHLATARAITGNGGDGPEAPPRLAAAPSTSWTSPPPACTSTTWPSCWQPSAS